MFAALSALVANNVLAVPQDQNYKWVDKEGQEVKSILGQQIEQATPDSPRVVDQSTIDDSIKNWPNIGRNLQTILDSSGGGYDTTGGVVTGENPAAPWNWGDDYTNKVWYTSLFAPGQYTVSGNQPLNITIGKDVNGAPTLFSIFPNYGKTDFTGDLNISFDTVGYQGDQFLGAQIIPNNTPGPLKDSPSAGENPQITVNGNMNFNIVWDATADEHLPIIQYCPYKDGCTWGGGNGKEQAGITATYWVDMRQQYTSGAANPDAKLEVNGNFSLYAVSVINKINLQGNGSYYPKFNQVNVFTFLDGATATINGDLTLMSGVVLTGDYVPAGTNDLAEPGTGWYQNNVLHVGDNSGKDSPSAVAINGNNITIFGFGQSSDAFQVKNGSTLTLGKEGGTQPALIRIIGGVDLDNTDTSWGSKTKSASITATFSGSSAFWYGDDYKGGDGGYKQVGHTVGEILGLNFTLQNGAQWIYIDDLRVRRLNLQNGGVVNLVDTDIQSKFNTEYVIPVHSENLDVDQYNKFSINGSWTSAVKEHNAVFIDYLNSAPATKANGQEGGVFLLDLDPNKPEEGSTRKTDLVFIRTGAGNHQVSTISSIDLVGKVSQDNPLLFAIVANGDLQFSAGDRLNHPTSDLVSYSVSIENWNRSEIAPFVGQYAASYEQYATSGAKTPTEWSKNLLDQDDLDSLTNLNSDAGLAAFDLSKASYWVITNSEVLPAETDSVRAIEYTGESGWAYATYLDRLSKRMGEIQYQDGDEGLWVRGRYNRTGNRNFDLKWGAVQIGGDYRNTERNRIGAAFEYNNGSADLLNVAGKNDLHGFNVMFYDTWRHEDGWYLDFTGRYGKFHNKMWSKTTLGERFSGSYRQSVFSLGLEGGKRIVFNEQGWFLEPQLQFQWARVGGANWSNQNGLHVDIDKGNSYIGRIGTQFGKEWTREDGRKNNIYVKADVLHEFGNGQKATLTADDYSHSIKKKWGSHETWYDAGISTQIAVGKQSWVHFDLEKEFGGGLKKAWQINGNIRWNF